MRKIETVEYHQEITHNGIRFQPFNAGHVLGAAMFLIDIAGVKTLYTGDFSSVPDRHLLGAERPPVSPDILIVESTYGKRELPSREEREQLFTQSVHDVVERGGRCLIPVFALGRAQELLLILEQYWEENKRLQEFPIYYASSLATRCMKMYQTFTSAMNQRVREQHANNKNPFEFKFIRPLADAQSLDDNGPCVVIASPGMLQSGVSLELFERWCRDRRNGVVIAGYCVDTTIAKQLESKPRQVQKQDGTVLDVRMGTVETISFSAHSDARQTSEFIRALPNTEHVILVHGNEGAIHDLKEKLTRDFKSRGLKVYESALKQEIRIPFSLQRSAKVMGNLAAKGEPREGQFVNGVLLVSAQNSHTIVHPSDILTFTGVTVYTIEQSMIMPLSTHKSEDVILRHLQTYFSQSEMLAGLSPHMNENDQQAHAAGSSQKVFRIHVAHDVVVDVEHSEVGHTQLTITWNTSRYNDLIADVTCIALAQLLQFHSTGALEDDHEVESSLLPMEVSGSDRLFRVKCFHQFMAQFYPCVRTDLITGTCYVTTNEGVTLKITDCIEIEEYEAAGKKLSDAAMEQFKTTLKRAYLTLFPIPVDYGWCDCGQIHTESLPDPVIGP
jgi:cleavage and polyadenylation specificity factor subunit 3